MSATALPTFEALPYGDKWRVNRCLVRGEAPADPRLARAAVEVAERLERQRPAYRTLLRWFPVILALLFGGLAVLEVVGGEPLRTALYGFIALVNVAQLMLVPATRPGNVAESLAASRRVAAVDQAT